MIHLGQEGYCEMLHQTMTPRVISNPQYIVAEESRMQLPVQKTGKPALILSLK